MHNCITCTPETITTLLINYQFSSVAQSCPNLCDPMNHSTPGLPVHHQPLEFTQTHVHGVGDAIQPSHPLSSPSAPAFNLYRAANFVVTFEIYPHIKRMFLMAPLFRWVKLSPRKSKEHGQGYTTSKRKRELIPELADTNFYIHRIVLSIILNFQLKDLPSPGSAELKNPV